MSALQKYYLKSLGLNVFGSNKITGVEQDIICISDFDILKKHWNISTFKIKSTII